MSFQYFIISTYIYTHSVPISKHSFDFILVPKCKPLFKLLDAFIISFNIQNRHINYTNNFS